MGLGMSGQPPCVLCLGRFRYGSYKNVRLISWRFIQLWHVRQEKPHGLNSGIPCYPITNLQEGGEWHTGELRQLLNFRVRHRGQTRSDD